MPREEIVFTCIAPHCERVAYGRHAICLRHLIIEISITAVIGFAAVSAVVWKLLEAIRRMNFP